MRVTCVHESYRCIVIFFERFLNISLKIEFAERKREMEILAPAGSESALIAAVQSGADAVYIGGSDFSARRTAKNFSLSDMKRWIDYCHIRGVAVHVTANILIKEKETNTFLDYIGELNRIGADALIIQDIGMAAKVRQMYPDLPLHASTQMTTASLDGVLFLAEMGFTRAVLSRELSGRELEQICKHSPIEIEVFVHGALCICYSGQCLMSSLIGGRSGNRGMCAQPCRLPYEFMQGEKGQKKGYLLSPKDLALIDELEALKKIGVASLKIEGRLKRAEYVAAVTETYCKYNNFTEKVQEHDIQTLKNAFNRSGFTKGYFTDKTGSDMMSIQTPGNVSENSFSPEVKNRCRPDANERKIPVALFAQLKKDEPLLLTLIDQDQNAVTVKGETKAVPANNHPLTAKRLKEQLTKLGNTPFTISSAEILIDEGIVIPVSQINALRRQATERLEMLRTQTPPRREWRNEDNKTEQLTAEKIVYNQWRQFKPSEATVKMPLEKEQHFTAGKDKQQAGQDFGKKLTAQIQTMDQAEALMQFDVPILYAPPELVEKVKQRMPERKVITVLPPIWRDKKRSVYPVIDGVEISHFAALKTYADVDCYGGFRLNIYNNESIRFYKHLKSLTLSPELNMNEIKQLRPLLPLEAVVYGRQALMVLENCPGKMYGSCQAESGALKDRQGEIFPLLCAPGCYAVLANSKPLYMADKMKALYALPISRFRMNFTLEDRGACEKILMDYQNAQNGSAPKWADNTFTRGHYYRGVE